MESSENNSIIDLTFFQNSGTIWNTREWKKLRRHRIVGNLVGHLPGNSHQEKEKGFPIILTRNETSLLLEKGLAAMTSCEPLLDEPGEEVKKKFRVHREVSFSKQVALLKELRREEILDKADLIVRGKLAKRRKMDQSCTDDSEELRRSIIEEEISKIADPSEAHLVVQICTEDPWTRSDDRKPVNWTYPSNETERLEYETFRSLWELGHWVTPGGKFGGHFLAYPGDPLLYHAQFIVKYTTKEEYLYPNDIIAFARLANSTRKTAVLSYFNVEGKINFQSLSWVKE